MDTSEEHSLTDKKREHDLFERELKCADLYLLQFALKIEALIAIASSFLDENEILEEKMIGSEIPCSRSFHEEIKLKDGNEWRLYVSFLFSPSEHILPIFVNNISPEIKLAYFFPEGNITYKINKGRFPEELISFCRMKKVVPFINDTTHFNFFTEIYRFFCGKMESKIKTGKCYRATNTLYQALDFANLIYQKVLMEEQIRSYIAALNKFDSLTSETSKALEATKSFTKSRKIAAIRERLESQSAAITAEWLT